MFDTNYIFNHSDILYENNVKYHLNIPILMSLLLYNPSNKVRGDRGDYSVSKFCVPLFALCDWI